MICNGAGGQSFESDPEALLDTEAMERWLAEAEAAGLSEAEWDRLLAEAPGIPAPSKAPGALGTAERCTAPLSPQEIFPLHTQGAEAPEDNPWIFSGKPPTPEALAIVSSQKQPPVQGRSKLITTISNFLFYAAIALCIFVALTINSGNGGVKSILGYSYMNVLTPSMESVIPPGSLVITKTEVDPDSIQVGDDVTFLREDNRSVTHRVVGIIEGYGGDGTRGFQTKGVDNPDPDPDIVAAKNIIGLVKLSIPGLGNALSVVSENLGITFAILGFVLVFSVALRAFLVENKKERSVRENRGQAKKRKRSAH
jgi:signal peptidase I